MGIHLISFKNSQGQFQSHYFSSYDEMVQFNYDFPDDVIVYEAERDWIPQKLNEHPKLRKYVHKPSRVGRRGELLFQKMADSRNFVAQEIDQDKDRYAKFIAIMGEKVKRSDFIILNLPDVEVDVKCLSLKEEKSTLYYRLEKEEIEKFRKYSHKTGRKLVFAIYRRNCNIPDEKSLAMIELSQLYNLPEEISHGKLFVKIPLSKLHGDFTLLERFAAENKSTQTRPYNDTQAINALPPEKNTRQVADKKISAWHKLLKTTKISLGQTFHGASQILFFYFLMYFATKNLQSSDFMAYILPLHLAFAAVIGLIILNFSRKNVFLPLCAVIVGGTIAQSLSKHQHFFIFPKSYYLIFMLMGVVGILSCSFRSILVTKQHS